MATPELEKIPLSLITFNPSQPRTNAQETDLASLAASYGDVSDPMIAQPPVVYPLPDGTYRIHAGERRIRAALQVGIKELPMVIIREASMMKLHRLSLLENLHRQELGTIDEAVAFKIFYLCLNGYALQLEEATEEIMASGSRPIILLQQLQKLLEDHGWQKHSPLVTYQTCLEELGLAIDRSTLMRRLRVLNLDIDIIEQIQHLPELTEAAIRSIGKISAEDQRTLLDEISQDTELIKKIRRICDQVTKGTYSIHEAIAEARGQVFVDPLSPSDSVLTRDDREQEDPISSDGELSSASTKTYDNESVQRDVTDSIMGCLDAIIQLETTFLHMASVIKDVTLQESDQQTLSDMMEILQQIVNTGKKI